MRVQVDYYPNENKTIVSLSTENTSIHTQNADTMTAYHLAKDLGLKEFHTTTYGLGIPTRTVEAVE